MKKFALVAFAVAGLAATSVYAQTATPPTATPAAPATAPAATPTPPVTAAAPVAASPAAVNYRKVCGKEVRQVCGPSPKGDKQARITRRECVAANKAKFSADCQAAITAREADIIARKETKRSEKQKL